MWKSTYSRWWLSIVGITSIFCFIAVSGIDCRNGNNRHFRTILLFLSLRCCCFFFFFNFVFLYFVRELVNEVSCDEIRFSFVKQFSVSAFCSIFLSLCFFLFGSGSFSVAFVQLEITFIRCLNCSYDVTRMRKQKWKKKKRKKGINCEVKLSLRRKLSTLFLHIYLCECQGRCVYSLFANASAHNGKLFHI